jgi:uncharacterized membrane protein
MSDLDVLWPMILVLFWSYFGLKVGYIKKNTKRTLDKVANKVNFH